MRYVKVLYAVYVIMKAEIILYKKFLSDLTTIVFKLNLYDPCVEKKLISCNKMNVVWHIDDINVGHKSNNNFDGMFKWIKKTYERIFEYVSIKMNIYIGNIHGYLGMTLDFQPHYNSISL